MTTATGQVEVPGATDGVALIPQPAPLTRLNYFDGKFLRAADLSTEQAYLRALAHLAAAAGGAGVVNGFDAQLRSGALVIGPGLAFDGLGRPLLLPAEATVDVDELVRLATDEGVGVPAEPEAGDRDRFGDCLTPDEGDRSRPVPSPDWWVVTVGYGETLCGEEDVYGRLCEEACAGATDRPWRVEGVVIRLEPLRLAVALPASRAYPLTSVHLRSRLAAACFADEQRVAGSLISAAGLRSAAWCLGSRGSGPARVPIALLARSGGTTAFLDPWIVRRERIDPPNERYWDGRLGLRPWTVFLAQVLQFQCQLRDLPSRGEAPEDDPCAPARQALGDVDQLLGELAPILDAARSRGVEGAPLLTEGGFDRFSKVRLLLRKVVDAEPGAGAASGAGRILPDHGIIELPPAGYLPVDPGSAVPVETQVGRLLGEGVDLRFCIARPDVIAQAFQHAQHLDRIPLTPGLDDPARRVPVDVLVPDGVIEAGTPAAPGRSYRAQLRILPLDRGTVAMAADGVAVGDAPASTGLLRGVATAGAAGAGGFNLRMAGAAVLARGPAIRTVENLVRPDAGPVDVTRTADQPDAPGVPEGDLIGVSETAARAMRFAATRDFRDVEGVAADESFNPPVERGAGRTAAAWLDVTFDGDLAAADGGDLVGIAVRAVIASPAASPLVMDVTLGGRLAITRVTAGAAGTRIVEGRIGDGVVRRHVVLAGQERADTTDPFRPDATIIVTITGSEVRRVSATIRHVGSAEDDETFALDVDLTQGPDEITADLAAGSGLARSMVRGEEPGADATRVTARLPLAALALAADPAILDLANPFNRMARAAVHIVAAAVVEAGMEEETLLKLLFPAPPASAAERVRATRDWVLFHHRADRLCTGATPVIPQPDRQFDLYHVLVDNPHELELLRRALATGDRAPLERLGLRRVDRVAFAGGTAALSTGAAAVAGAWSTAQAGAVIVYGAIGTQGDVDGAATNRNRVVRITEAVAPVSRLDPRAEIDVLPGVPAGMVAAGADGVIVVATHAAGATTCIDVRRVAPKEAAAVVRLLSSGAVADALGRTAELGVVRYEDLTPVEGLDDVTAAWGEQGGQVVGGVTVSTGAAPAGSSLDRAERAGAVIAALPGAARVQDLVVAELDAACPVVLLLVPAPQDEPAPPQPTERQSGHMVVAVKAMRAKWHDEVQPRLADGVIDDSLLAELEQDGILARLGFVVYKPGTTDVGAPFAVRQLADEPDFAGTVSGAITLYERASLTDQPGVLGAQAVQAAKDVGVTIAAGDVEVIEVPRPPVTSREVLTILLVQRD